MPSMLARTYCHEPAASGQQLTESVVSSLLGHAAAGADGWADIGYHANAPGYPSSAKQRNETASATPHIDSLVKDGVELDQNYVFKYCSPTRCSLQTGRNPVHVNVSATKPGSSQLSLSVHALSLLGGEPGDEPGPVERKP